MPLQIETERLVLRELVAEDAEDLFRLDSDPEVHRYIGGQPVTTLQQCQYAIAFIREQYVTNGVGRLAVITKATNEFVGWSGLKLMRDTINGHTDFLDIGYRFIREHWGKGYATESAGVMRDYAFETLGAGEIFAMTDVANTASRKALEKIGLQYITTFNYDGTNTANNWRNGPEPTTWYRLGREEWANRRQ